jgi:hypothetical protein
MAPGTLTPGCRARRSADIVSLRLLMPAAIAPDGVIRGEDLEEMLAQLTGSARQRRRIRDLTTRIGKAA